MEKEPQYLLQDALREVTRKERRNLLGSASIGIIIAWAKVKLSTISIFGLTFQGISDDRLLSILGCAVVYFFAAFLIYAVSDLVAWGFAVADARSEKETEDFRRELEQRKQWESEEERKNRQERSKNWMSQIDFDLHKRDVERYKIVQAAKEKRQSYYLPSLIVSSVRAVFDFILPLIVGIYAIRLLILS
ncbi:hypothetical protein [Desulfomonile tiedjei]|uniref:Uncharacterized protein n=1 Tax=Desulfomonile tiedjei (strain ATCC 49306 / DSM 6799 / DCB-1) TaxID=706587 RepID=I4C769_DESTA|nr:hypothetical protein [Desulfomonile tiedjei]AFM25410.1 hypothetical protein Desti_2733 [Desulfomonile tiedjei DSM 6799]